MAESEKAGGKNAAEYSAGFRDGYWQAMRKIAENAGGKNAGVSCAAPPPPPADAGSAYKNGFETGGASARDDEALLVFLLEKRAENARAKRQSGAPAADAAISAQKFEAWAAELPKFPKWQQGLTPSMLQNWLTVFSGRIYSISDLRMQALHMQKKAPECAELAVSELADSMQNMFGEKPFELAVFTRGGSLYVTRRYKTLAQAQSGITRLALMTDAELAENF